MQDVTNRPSAADATPPKEVNPLTLGAAAAAIKRELGFAELSMRETVYAAWAEIDWKESEARRAMSLKEQIAELCSEMSIWTGWNTAASSCATPPQQLVFTSDPVAESPANDAQVAQLSTPVAATPEKVVKARANRRAMFMEEMKSQAEDAEAGGQVSAEKFIREDPLCRPLMESDLGVVEQPPTEDIEEDEDEEDEEEEPDMQEPQERKRSRSENKSRKAMGKLGMTPVQGVARCTFKKSNGVVFAIARPGVYTAPGGGGTASSPSSCYVIFGAASVEDHSGQARRAQTAAAGVTQLPPRAIFPKGAPAAAAAAAAAASESGSAPTGAASGADTGAEAAARPHDDTPEADIELVTAQSGASRAVVCAALRKHQGDIVNAILECSQ